MRKVPKSMILMAVIILASSALIVTYATGYTNSSAMTITINENGEVVAAGNIFNTNGADTFDGHIFDGKWYPGKEKSGIIKIVNNYRDGNVTIDGLNVDIIDFKEPYTEEEVETSFLNYMVLTLEGKGLISKTIIDNKTLSYIKTNGLDDNQFSVSAGASVELEYKLLMHEDAGNELQRLKASIDLLLHIEGVEISGDNNKNNNSNHNRNKNNRSELDSELPVVEKYELKDGTTLHIKFPLINKDDLLFTEKRNVGLKIVTMVADKEQIIASCRLSGEINLISKNETHYIVNFIAKDCQFEPDATYTAYVYDIDTEEKLLEPVSFTVDATNTNQLWEKQ